MSPEVERTYPHGGQVAFTAHPGATVANRYLLRERLGQGANGTVWEALDLLSGEPVAVKVVASLAGHQRDRIRRELTALRWLNLPGVVGLRDDGPLGEGMFLVMDLVRGRPFPQGPTSWDAIRPTVIALLETLAAMHRAGVVHRDLKPENVLVDEDGRPTLIDFGLALGSAVLEDLSSRAEGTPRYIAPEQLLRGPADARADLYSVGVMLYEALSGRAPHGTDAVRSVLARRLRRPAPRLRRHAPHVPEHVCALVDALLERDPADRPPSAEAVIAELGGVPVDSRVQAMLAELPDPVDPGRLQDCFGPANRFLHLPKDVAALAIERAGRRRADLERELARWVRRGLARFEGGRLVVDRLSLARIAELDLALPDDPAQGVERAIREASRLRQGGRVREGMAWLDRARGLLREVDDPALKRRWLVAWCCLAAVDGMTASFRRALYEVGRAQAESWLEAGDLDDFLRVALAASEGDLVRARFHLGRLQRPLEPDLQDELCAQRALVASKEGPESLQRELEAMVAWADTPERQGRLLSWRGILLSRMGRRSEALDLLLQASDLRTTGMGLLSAWLNAATIAQALGRLDLAEELAGRVLERSVELRLPLFQVTALWILRGNAYRRGAPLPPDAALVEEAAAIKPWKGFMCGLVEAASAWRQGDLPLARRLASRAAELALQEGFGLGAWLATCLAAAAGEPQDLDLLESARPEDQRGGDIEPQGLGLLALARRAPRPALLPAVERALQVYSPAERAIRRDVLSLDEALAAVRTGRLDTSTPGQGGNHA